MSDTQFRILVSQLGAREVAAALDRLTASSERARKATDERRKSEASARSESRATVGAIRAVVAAFGIREIAEIADTYTTIGNRLRFMTGNAGTAAEAQKELFKAAQATRMSFAETVGVYSRVSLATRNLGVTQREVIDATTVLNQAALVSGATHQEAIAGIRQFTQALASGRLQGDEFRSVMENIPYVADLLARHLGVTRGELYKLRKEGKLTGKELFESLLEAKDQVGREFQDTIPTIAQSLDVLKNEFVNTFGVLESNFHVIEKLTSLFGGLREVIAALSGTPLKGGIFDRLTDSLVLDAKPGEYGYVSNIQEYQGSGASPLAGGSGWSSPDAPNPSGPGFDPAKLQADWLYYKSMRDLHGGDRNSFEQFDNSFISDMNIDGSGYAPKGFNMVRASGGRNSPLDIRGQKSPQAPDPNAVREWASFLKQFEKAREDASPLYEALHKMNEEQGILTKGFEKGLFGPDGLDEYLDAMDKVSEKYDLVGQLVRKITDDIKENAIAAIKAAKDIAKEERAALHEEANKARESAMSPSERLAKKFEDYDFKKRTGQLSAADAEALKSGSQKDLDPTLMQQLNDEILTFNQLVGNQAIAGMNRLGDTIANFVTTGKFAFKDFANSVIADFARIASQQLIFNGVQALFGGGGTFLGAHATGGSYMVGGSGAPDSQLISARVSPGERIDILTKGQQESQAQAIRGAGQGTGNVKVVVVDNREDAAHQLLNSEEGERLIMHTLHRNGIGK